MHACSHVLQRFLHVLEDRAGTSAFASCIQSCKSKERVLIFPGYVHSDAPQLSELCANVPYNA